MKIDLYSDHLVWVQVQEGRGVFQVPAVAGGIGNVQFLVRDY